MIVRIVLDLGKYLLVNDRPLVNICIFQTVFLNQIEEILRKCVGHMLHPFSKPALQLKNRIILFCKGLFCEDRFLRFCFLKSRLLVDCFFRI